MLCTDCGTKLRPVVAVDIDGTLGQYHGHLLNFAIEYLGGVRPLHVDSYDGNEQFKYWFCRTFRCDLRTFRDIKLAYRQGAKKRSMPPYKDVAEFAAAIHDAKAELWVTTTRPYLRYDGVDPDTRFWLDRQGIKYDGLLYDEDKYAVLAERVDPGRVVMVLDDLVENLQDAHKIFGERVPVLRRQLYNRNVPWSGSETDDLGLAAGIVIKRIEEWYARQK